MHRSELHYDLPPERIAQQPVEPRDAARLLVLHRQTGRTEHRVFREIVECLAPGDLLVVNDTRVIPARFFARRESGGRIECLFLRAEPDGWRVLLRPSTRLRVGEQLRIERSDARLSLLARDDGGEWRVAADPPAEPLALLEAVGEAPLPPYIHRPGGATAADRERYQTVYARAPGAVAAPTAGLHFTPELLARLDARGIQRASVTLHVGVGTFSPIKCEDLRDHVMHAEWFEIGPDAAARWNACRERGGRVVAVGTTAARVLESAAAAPHGPQPHGPQPPPAATRPLLTPQAGWTRIFIYPPYSFRGLDALVTNFHLPESTLLALVMALAGREPILAAYREAVERGYRFYSYGDAMLII